MLKWSSVTPTLCAGVWRAHRVAGGKGYAGKWGILIIIVMMLKAKPGYPNIKWGGR